MKNRITPSSNKVCMPFLIITLLIFLCSLSFGQNSKPTAVSITPGSTGYASVNGLQMYYEIFGKGEPLVLLHGAFSNAHTDFDNLLPALSAKYQVIAIEQQGHGHTDDIDRPLRIDQMTDDTAGLLKHLKITKANIVGYSMGGGIAFNLALRHPDLVKKFVWAGGVCYDAKGFYPEVAGMKNMKPEALVQALQGTPWQQAFEKIAPHPQSWSGVVAKKIEMDQTFTGWKSEEVKRVTVPSLLIEGDADISTPEHVSETFRLLGGGVIGDMYGLPNARLAILPGTTHVTLINRTEWLSAMIIEFLQAPVK
jgi:pimeloyl-ACP methyl ester carboxylesterase